MMHSIIQVESLHLSQGTPDEGISSSPRFRILVTNRGQVRVSVDGTVCHAEAGSVLLVAPYELLYISNKMTDDASVYIFDFDSSAPLSQLPLDDIFGGALYYSRDALPTGVDALLLRMQDISVAASDMSTMLSKLLLTELLLRLSASTHEREVPAGCAKAAAYLRAHMTEDVTLDALAEYVDISKFYLCRAFSRDCGLTPHAYLNHLRAFQAEKLLGEGMGAKEVSEAVGFSDYSTFFRTYRKILGRTPTAILCEADE